MRTLLRWLKFNAVGIAGAAVQLWFLHLLTKAGATYQAATVLAVEAAVLHNFAWHQRYTWADRPCDDVLCVMGRLFRFQLTNGTVSIAGNLFIMHILAGWLRVHILPANLAAILVCSLLNFLLGDRVVFRGRPPVSA